MKKHKCLEFASTMEEEPIYYFLLLYLTSVEILDQKYTCPSCRALSGWISTKDQSHGNTTDPRELVLYPYICLLWFGLSDGLKFVWTRIPVILMAFNVMLLFSLPKERGMREKFFRQAKCVMKMIDYIMKMLRGMCWWNRILVFLLAYSTGVRKWPF